jgi:integrase
MLVSELLDEYLRDCELRGARAMSHLRRQRAQAEASLGQTAAAELSTRELYLLQRQLRERKYAPSTVNGVLGCLRAAFRFGVRVGLIGQMPLFPRALPDRPARRGVIEPEVYAAILAECPEWVRDPFAVLYATGWRRSEIVWLEWGEVDIEGRALRLAPERSKNREPRVFPWMGIIPEVIARRTALRVVGLPFVFHREGRRLNNTSFDRAFRDAATRAGYPSALVHDCRRTKYRDLLRAGVLEKVAREMVGWRGARTPERYHIVNERDYHEAAERYSEWACRSVRRGL